MSNKKRKILADLTDDILNVYSDFGGIISIYDSLYFKITGKSSPERVILQQIENDKMNLLKDKNSLVVIGETNVGKSLFINLLLGDDILGVNQSTETAVLTIVRTPQPDAEIIIHFFPKDYVERLEQQLDAVEREERPFIKRMIKDFQNDPELRSLLGKSSKTIKLSGSIEKSKEILREFTSGQRKPPFANGVEFVELYYDSAISASDLQIIDSPGLDDANPLRPNLTKAYLEEADIILLMIGRSGVKKTTRDTVRFILSNQLADKLIIVANRIDEVEDVDAFMETTKEKIEYDVFDIIVEEIQESDEDEERKQILIEYINGISKNIQVFPLSAKKATENKNKKNDLYFNHFEEIIRYVDQYLISDDFVKDKANRHLLRYGDQIYNFENKITNTIAAVISGNLERAKQELTGIKKLEKDVEDKSNAIFGKFERVLNKRIKQEFDDISDEHKKSTKNTAFRILENGDISSWRPKVRKRKAKELLENEIQPAIRSSVRDYGKALNKAIEKVANEEVAKMDVEIREMISTVQKDYQEQSLSLRKHDPGLDSDFNLTGGILLQLGGATISLGGPVIIGGIVTAILSGPISIGLGILVIAGGIFASLLSVFTGGELLSKGVKLFTDARDGVKLKEALKKKLDNEIDRIFIKVNNDFDSDKVSSEIVKEIEKEITLYFSQLKDPFLIALEAGGDVGISDKFTTIKNSTNKLKKIFKSLKDKYEF